MEFSIIRKFPIIRKLDIRKINIVQNKDVIMWLGPKKHCSIVESFYPLTDG